VAEARNETINLGTALLGLIGVTLTRPIVEDRIDPSIIKRDTLFNDLAILGTTCLETAGAFCALAVDTLLFDGLKIGAEKLNKDPPDPNYREVYTPTTATPQTPVTEACSSLPAASELTPFAIDQAASWLSALDITLNRYGSALAAGDISSADRQDAAIQSYLGMYAASARTASLDLRCTARLFATEGLGTEIPTSQQFADAFALLQGGDQTLPFVADLFASLGLSDLDLSSVFNDILLNPPVIPTLSLVDTLNAAADALEETAAITALAVNVPEPDSLLVLLQGLMIFGFSSLFTNNALGTRWKRAHGQQFSQIFATSPNTSASLLGV
jgi:hypothetical protein